ncbi:MAG: hypothetical protein ABS76_14365 [Pelagibacterium sp. SCN 64-44]|nr:MAG: hypothetical protein ABS76_14365 [Pelagibacterium sp. SCN 64-44]
MGKFVFSAILVPHPAGLNGLLLLGDFAYNSILQIVLDRAIELGEATISRALPVGKAFGPHLGLDAALQGGDFVEWHGVAELTHRAHDGGFLALGRFGRNRHFLDDASSLRLRAGGREGQRAIRVHRVPQRPLLGLRRRSGSLDGIADAPARDIRRNALTDGGDFTLGGAGCSGHGGLELVIDLLHV